MRAQPADREARATAPQASPLLTVIVPVYNEATCYKVFRTADLKAMDLECERFEFCPEVTAKACRMGLRIVEVPIRYRGRGRKDGKKIGLPDGVTALRTLWRYRRWSPAPAEPAPPLRAVAACHPRGESR